MANKVPRFVTIYDTLFEEIENGIYPVGATLPTEQEMCTRFGVSRMTVRQAIKILNEDGIIESERGRGHFVMPYSARLNTQKATLTQHPLRAFTDMPLTYERIAIRIDEQSDYTNLIFPDHPEKVVAIERYFYDDAQTECRVFCFTFVPLTVFETNGIDVEDEAAIKLYLSETAYQHRYKSDFRVRLTDYPGFEHENDTTRANADMSNGDLCYLFSETIYANKSSPIVSNKWYVKVADAQIDFAVNQEV